MFTNDKRDLTRAWMNLIMPPEKQVKVFHLQKYRIAIGLLTWPSSGYSEESAVTNKKQSSEEGTYKNL